MRVERRDKAITIPLVRHFCTLAAMAVTLASGSSLALEIRGGNEVHVSEKINDDLFMGGTDNRFDGEIRGDVIATGMDVAVDGIVDGNVNVAGYMVKVGGNVYRSVRLVGYKLTTDGQIGNNLLMVGAFTRLSSTCEVTNDVHILGGKVDVNGAILGNLAIEGDEVCILGTVGGDVTVSCEKLTIERSAVIVGDLTYSSPEKAKIADGAQMDGRTKWEKITKSDSAFFDSVITKLVFFVGAFIVGFLIFSLCRSPACSVRDAIASDVPKALGVGIVIFIVVPIALILALIFIVTIPLSLVALLAYIVLFYVSKLFVAVYLGGKVMQVVSSSGPKSNTLSLFIGLIILTILFNLPYVGWIVYLLAVMVGLGGIAIAFNKSKRRAQA
jgi:cytoskeletal protein CcmA (bactofilin family)